MLDRVREQRSQATSGSETWSRLGSAEVALEYALDENSTLDAVVAMLEGEDLP